MITTISITQNPVTNWEHFSRDLTPGTGRRRFSRALLEHQAYGGFWACSFTMHDTLLDLLQFLDSGLGRHVLCKNEYGGIDFEGFINTMILTMPTGIRLRISLDSVANEIRVRYKDAAGAFARSAEATDADSQDRFGIKELTLSAGQLTATSIANNLATMVLRRKRWPKKAVEALSLGGGRPPEMASMEVNCLGYIHTLEWRTYNQTASTGTQSADLQLADIIGTRGKDADSLLTSLISWWDLEEASGTRKDAHGTNDLTDAGSVTNALGRGNVGLAADFESGDASDYLTIADNASLSVADEAFTVACWVKPESLPGTNMAVVHKGGSSLTAVANPYELHYLGSTSRWRIGVSNNTTRTAVSHTTPPVAGRWQCVIAWHDPNANTINIQVDNGDVVKASHTAGAYDDAGTFRVGADGTGGSRFDGLIDSVVFSKRVWTAEERSRFYNGGVGLSYSDLQQAVSETGVGQFVADTDFKANSIGVTKEYDADRDALSICFDIARLGDAQNPPQRWVLYMKEGRTLVYEPAAPEQLISG